MMQLSIVLLLPQAATAAQVPSNSVFRWSSTGGGWRSMFGCIGYANVFRQDGLFTEDDSLFDAIATTSGASWFSTQLFYSQAFYNQTVLAESPQDLYDFVVQWMASYYSITQTMEFGVDVTMANMTNLMVENEGNANGIDPITFLVDFLDLFQAVGGDWGTYIAHMMQTAADDYGHEGTPFSALVANAENRLRPLQATDLLVQTALVPSSRVRSDATKSSQGEGEQGLLERVFDFFDLDEDQDMAIYFGPVLSNNTEKIYTAPFSAGYIVNETYTGFTYATLESNSGEDLMTYAAPTSTDFDFEDWDSFYLWGDETPAQVKVPTANAIDGLTTTPESGQDNGKMVNTGTMPRPFGGEDPTVIQLSAISSAFGGGVSPTAPSVFSQFLSLKRSLVGEAGGPFALAAFDSTVDAIYESDLFDDIAVCSQWPKALCHGNEGRFIDGGYVDNPTVAINVGQYQASADADLTKTLKLVLTNTNENYGDAPVDPTEYMRYFATDLNRGVPPGDFLWAQFTPIRSPQIFRESMTSEKFQSMMMPLEGSSMSTAILRGTTIDNPPFGIRASQRVEILLLNQNAPISTLIAGATAIQDTTLPLAQSTKAIAENQELVQRVKDFFFGKEQVLNLDSTATVSKSSSGSLRQAAPQSANKKPSSSKQEAETIETRPDLEDGLWIPSSGGIGGHFLVSAMLTVIASIFVI